MNTLDVFHKPLRVGLLIDSWEIPNWVASIAADITASDSAEITVVIINRMTGNRHHFLLNKAPRPNPFRLAQFYLYLDYRVFHPLPDALEQVNLKEQLERGPVMETELLFDGVHFRFNEQDKNRLQQFDIDVLLLFCSGLPSDHVFPLARYGVWFFIDHELLLTGHAPVGFWEVLEQYPVTTQCLQAYIVGSPKPIILHRYYGPTDLRSIRKSRNNLLWKSASFVIRKLEELHRSGSLEAIGNVQQCCEDGLPRRVPSNLTMLRITALHVSRFVRDQITNRRYFDQWVIGYKFNSSGHFIDRNFADYHWLLPPKDRYWADPFSVQTRDRYFRFFEEALYSENKGHLCVVSIDQNGIKEEPKIILKHEYHLSYPSIFSWKGEWYLIPETQKANRIDVYKFDLFPYKLTYYKTVMENVNAADTTLLEINGQWWMFVSLAPRGTWNVDELFLFYADNPFGPWVSHPKNPIKSDVRSARPAGQLFERQGKYYRPAQDCSHGYGYAVRIQEIEVLSEMNYIENEAEVILPDWSPDIVATHTLNIGCALTVIDAKQRRLR